MTHRRGLFILAMTVLLALSSATRVAAAVIRLDGRANGRTLRVHTGERIVVTLNANASTGYAWHVVSTARPVLRLDSVRYLPVAKPGMVGVPGRYVARFTVQRTGRGRIVLVYVRHTRPVSTPSARFTVAVVSVVHTK